jgi:hypothetical protein
MIIENAFWNGEPCFAKAVKVIVGKSPRETWWCAALAGKEHSAIEISQGAERFYINDDADGREKITIGFGLPQWNHSSLPVERVLDEPTN